MGKLTRSQVEDAGFTVKGEKYPWQFSNGLLDLITDIYPKTGDIPLGTNVSIYSKRFDAIVFYGRIENEHELTNVLTYISR